MEQIEANPKVIIDLTKEIKSCLTKINNLNSELSTQLKSLGSTFQDEGYQVIQGYVSNSQAKFNEALPDMKIVMEKLIEYAQLLIESKKAIS